MFRSPLDSVVRWISESPDGFPRVNRDIYLFSRTYLIAL